MNNDYRNTKYCPDLSGIKDRKNEIYNQIILDHPRATDMHNYISKNDLIYKKHFLKAYNYKCAYCGVSIDIISKSEFEIDHYIYQKSSEFKSKKQAGTIDNLVLSCHSCNHAKSDFIIPTDKRSLLYPDDNNITKVFYRNDKYYIMIYPEYKEDKIVCDFYNKLKLHNDIHRLDYLLMSMIGLYEKKNENTPGYTQLGKAIELLRKKRNIVS